MRAILKDGLMVLVPEGAGEAAELSAWQARHTGHVLHVKLQSEEAAAALELWSLGPREEACREPINIVSSSPDPMARLIGNFGAAPFYLDGETYRTVESFWQGLKFAELEDRRRLAMLDGREAWAAGSAKGYGATVCYAGKDIVVGTWAHWQLMERACRAKFEQSAEARDALLATGGRPLTHILPSDSKSIPGAIMAEIWMRIRRALQHQATPPAP